MTEDYGKIKKQIVEQLNPKYNKNFSQHLIMEMRGQIGER